MKQIDRHFPKRGNDQKSQHNNYKIQNRVIGSHQNQRKIIQEQCQNEDIVRNGDEQLQFIEKNIIQPFVENYQFSDSQFSYITSSQQSSNFEQQDQNKIEENLNLKFQNQQNHDIIQEQSSIKQNLLNLDDFYVNSTEFSQQPILNLKGDHIEESEYGQINQKIKSSNTQINKHSNQNLNQQHPIMVSEASEFLSQDETYNKNFIDNQNQNNMHFDGNQFSKELQNKIIQNLQRNKGTQMQSQNSIMNQQQNAEQQEQYLSKPDMDQFFSNKFKQIQNFNKKMDKQDKINYLHEKSLKKNKTIDYNDNPNDMYQPSYKYHDNKQNQKKYRCKSQDYTFNQSFLGNSFKQEITNGTNYELINYQSQPNYNQHTNTSSEKKHNNLNILKSKNNNISNFEIFTNPYQTQYIDIKQDFLKILSTVNSTSRKKKKHSFHCPLSTQNKQKNQSAFSKRRNKSPFSNTLRRSIMQLTSSFQVDQEMQSQLKHQESIDAFKNQQRAIQNIRQGNIMKKFHQERYKNQQEYLVNQQLDDKNCINVKNSQNGLLYNKQTSYSFSQRSTKSNNNKSDEHVGLQQSQTLENKEEAQQTKTDNISYSNKIQNNMGILNRRANSNLKDIEYCINEIINDKILSQEQEDIL